MAPKATTEEASDGMYKVRSLPQARICRDGLLRTHASKPLIGRASRHSSVVSATKKGIGTYWYDHNDSSLYALQPQVSWYYTWSSSPSNISGTDSATNGGGLEFVPMIWGVHSDPKQLGGDNRTIKHEIDNLYQNSAVLLGYNEPDGSNQGQSNIDVSTAADNWPQLEATGKRLGSPATAQRATVSGDHDPTWMELFMDQVNSRGLRVDFMCVHWYPGNHTSMTDAESAASELAAYVTAVHEKWGRPIWVTEFALIDYNHGGTTYPTLEHQVAFARTAVYKLEAMPFVERYAWYALPNGKDNSHLDINNGLFEENGSITDVGTAYKFAHGP